MERGLRLQLQQYLPKGQASVTEDESNPANWLYKTLSSRNSAVVDIFAELFIFQAKPDLHCGIVICFSLISYFGFLRLTAIFFFLQICIAPGYERFV